MAYIGREPQLGNFQVCDAISVVNAQAAYTMQVSSVDVSPESVNHMVVSLNGVIQKPGSSYTISSATITFSRNLVTGETIDFIYLLGNVLDLGTPSDDTVTGAKIVDNAINSEHYTDASIDLAHMSDNSIDSNQYVDGSIDTAHIGADQITAAKIADNAVVTAGINADAVTGAKIADDAINSEHYTDGSIDTAHIADNQITLAKLAGGTDGNIISYDASGDPVAIATGSDGQVLTSTGAGSAPAFEDAGGGAHTLISTATISNAATAAVTGMDNTYARYLITIDNLKSANDDVAVYMQVIIGGAIKTGTNYPYGNSTRNSADGAEGNESADSTFFKISKSSIGNATGENFSGEITLYNPSETSQFKNIGWRNICQDARGTVDTNIGGGYYKDGQAAITGVSIKMAGGNITSAVIKLYGIT